MSRQAPPARTLRRWAMQLRQAIADAWSRSGDARKFASIGPYERERFLNDTLAERRM